MNDFDLGAALAEETFREKIERWLLWGPGEFSIAEIYRDLGFQTPENKAEAFQACEYFVKSGLLERVGSRRGMFRPTKKNLKPIDFTEADDTPVNIWLPFGLSNMVEIMPGNVIILAGQENSGKTALVLNIIRWNFRQWKIHYFNSEMGAGEMKKRLKLFDGIVLSDWKFDAYERDSDFSDVIFPGEGNLNIIDFLECHDEFYKMGAYIKDIHAKLDGAIAIICIQKNPGSDDGIGGKRTMEKARLALALSPGECKITKAKNFKSKDNPNQAVYKFKLVNGCKLVEVETWSKQTIKKIKRDKNE